MTISAQRVAVTTTATLLTTQTDLDGKPANYVRVYNPATNMASIYIGPAGVTAATGFEIPAGSTVPLDLTAPERIYGVAAAGSLTVHVLQEGT